MSSEIVSLVSLLLSLLTWIYTVGKDVKDEEREEIKKIALAVKKFYDNFLGWYNRIMNFSSSVLVTGRLDTLTEERIGEYTKMLRQIRDDDVYYSKVHGFLDSWRELLKSVTFVRGKKKLGEGLRDLEARFGYFENDLFGLKNKLGELLQSWSRMNSIEKITFLDELETEMMLFEGYKNRVAEILNQIQNL